MSFNFIIISINFLSIVIRVFNNYFRTKTNKDLYYDMDYYYCLKYEDDYKYKTSIDSDIVMDIRNVLKYEDDNESKHVVLASQNNHMNICFLQ